MHEFPHIPSGSSTSRDDFIRHDIHKREEQRLTALKTNKVSELMNTHKHAMTPLSRSLSLSLSSQERHSKLAVELRNSAQYSDHSNKKSSETAYDNQMINF